MLEKLFKQLSLSIIKVPYVYLIVIAVLTLIMLYFAFPIRIDTDLMKMAPANDPYVTAYADYLDNTGGDTFNILMIKVDKNNLPLAKKFAQDAVNELISMPKYVKYIVSYKDGSLIQNYGLYYLSNDQLKNINFNGSSGQNYLTYLSSLLGNGIKNFKSSITLKLSTRKIGMFPRFVFPKSSDILTSTKFLFNSVREFYSYIYVIPYLFGNVQPLIDSIKIYNVVNSLANTSKYLNDIQKIMNNFNDLRKNQYYQITPDQKYIVITMIMSKPSSDFKFIDESFKALNNLMGKLSKKYNVQYGFTGSYAMVKDNKDAISYSLQSTTIFSLIGIIILFALAYKKFSYIATVILVLGISTIWLLAIVNLLIGHFNSITSFMIATLLGLGIDYSIHLTSAYIRERHRGGIAEEGIIVSLTEVGPSITIGSLTTAAAFLILVVAPSQAFRELAIIASVGILSYWIVAIITIPTVLAIFRKSFKPGKKTSVDSKILKPLSEFIQQHYILIIIFFVIVSVAISFYAYRTINNFDYSNSNLVTPGLKSEVLFNDLLRSTSSTPTTSIYAYASSLDDIDSIEKKIEADSQLSKFVISMKSIKDYLPQYDNIKRFYINKILNEFHYLETNPIFMAFMDKWHDFKYMMDNCDKLKNYTQLELDKTIISNPSVLLPIKLNYLYDGKYIVSINVTSKIFGGQFQQFFDACENSGIDLVGYSTALYSVMKSVKNSTWLTLAASIIAISIIIFLSFKNLLYSLSTLSVLFMALWWMFGFMGIFNYKMDMITAIVMPLIIGIGVDNGVHMTNSFIVNGENVDSVSKSLLGTGKALTFSMATTVLAFASGLFSNNPAFKEIGVTLSIGIVSSYLAGMFLVPAIYVLIERRRSKSLNIKITKGGE